MEFRLHPYVVVLALVSFLSLSAHVTALTVVGVGKNPEVNATPLELGWDLSVRCARVHVSGLSRLKLGSYSSTHRAAVVPSPEIHQKSFKRIQVCLHSNSSLGLCRCENDNWESMQDGMWGSNIMSPYGDKYIDVRFDDNLSGSVTVSVREEFQRWRVICLFIGLVLLLVAPVFSGWVPFYYSTSMAIGICLLVLVVLFKGMKLLPTGRKTALFSTVFGLAIGAGSFLLKRFPTLMDSILVRSGINEEMHKPILLFIIVLIVLAGAGFGYWLVRKFVVAEDGTVNVGIAQFVKWGMRILGLTSIFCSTVDIPLAIVVSVLGIYKSFTIMRSFGGSEAMNSRTNTLWRKLAMSPRNPGSPPSITPDDCYSSYHTIPNRNKFTKNEWKESKERHTKNALTEWAASPEVIDWMIKSADKIRLYGEDSSDESTGSTSDSTEESSTESSSSSSSERGFWRWCFT